MKRQFLCNQPSCPSPAPESGARVAGTRTRNLVVTTLAALSIAAILQPYAVEAQPLPWMNTALAPKSGRRCSLAR